MSAAATTNTGNSYIDTVIRTNYRSIRFCRKAKAANGNTAVPAILFLINSLLSVILVVV